MIDRLFGILLFLPVPAVLWLFTAAPFGVGRSLALGAGLVATHRLYARPFALSRAARRCLWCGGAPHQPQAVTLREPLGLTPWVTCSRHRAPLLRFFSFAARFGMATRVGILGSILLLFVASMAWRFDGAVALFRLGVAITVLPLGWFASWCGTLPSNDTPLPTPFPVHIQALIGTYWVTWLFGLVGIVWLVRAVWWFFS